MNQNYFEFATKWLELSTDSYRTYVKTLVAAQERSLEITRTMITQAEKFQKENKGLVEEYTNQLNTAQKYWQGTWKETTRNTLDVINQYREATSTTISNLNQNVDALQTRIEAASRN